MALLTTQGFRDVLELARQWRGAEVYNLFAARPSMLVPRERIFGVCERIGSRGEVVTPLDEGSVQEIVAALKALEVDSVAVCFLFSFLNPSHEKRVASILRQALPTVAVSLSSEVAPEFREYERTSTVVIDGYVKPSVTRYFRDFRSSFSALGEGINTYVMRSSGGLTDLEEAARLPVQSMFSGPVAGAMGACFLSKAMNWPNLITLDMGGTSTDMAIVVDGQPVVTKEREVEGRALNIPMVEVSSIGSGGGSIASVFAGRTLKVGPESAGAVPGPVCYSRGGTRPTLSDAWAVLGYLPSDLLGTDLKIDRKAAEEAIQREIAGPLSISVEDAADSIAGIAIADSYELMRLITIDRGLDPAEFRLVAYGGAGPVYAAAVARDLGVPTVCVPRHPGLFSAFGFFTTDLTRDYVETRIASMSDLAPEDADAIFAQLEDQARRDWPGADIRRFVDLRYKGQAYELMIGAPPGPWTPATYKDLTRVFNEAHQRRYGMSADREIVEFVVFRVRSVVAFPRPRMEATPPEAAAAPARETQAYFSPAGWMSTPVHAREDLGSGFSCMGPAIVTEYDSTTVVYPGQRLEVDPFGNLLIHTAPSGST
jgi:N-methylhydantoinase A